MIKPLTQGYLEAGLDENLMVLLLVLELRDRMKEVIEHINGEPDIDEQILKNIRAEIEKNRRSPAILSTTQGSFGGNLKKKCDHTDCMICNECDEPDIDEQIEKNEKLQDLTGLLKDLPDVSEVDVGEMQRIIEIERRSPDPDCTTCNGTGVIDHYFDDGRSFPCYCYKRKDEPDELDDDCLEHGYPDPKKTYPAGDVCKAHLDNTDKAFEDFDSRSYNIKLWTRDMRKMIKGKNISPKLKDDIRRKLKELEDL